MLQLSLVLIVPTHRGMARLSCNLVGNCRCILGSLIETCAASWHNEQLYMYIVYIMYIDCDLLVMFDYCSSTDNDDDVFNVRHLPDGDVIQLFNRRGFHGTGNSTERYY